MLLNNSMKHPYFSMLRSFTEFPVVLLPMCHIIHSVFLSSYQVNIFILL